jgi:hypothetical protein
MGLLKRIYSGKNEPSQALLRNASSPEGGAFIPLSRQMA